MWKIIYRTGEEFETNSILISDEQYQQLQQALRDGDEFIIIENRPTIKRSYITSINRANSEEEEAARVAGIAPPPRIVTGKQK